MPAPVAHDDYRRVTPGARRRERHDGMRGNTRLTMTDRPSLLSGLLASRNELAEEVSMVEAQLRQHYETLRTLDHLIRLEDPDADLPAIRNSKLADMPKTAMLRGSALRSSGL
jgi:hypothetical protein